MMAGSFIEISDLCKSFGEQEVLKGVSISIGKGDSIAIIGQSGCGKSVLLKHLIKLLEPDSGQVIIDGADIAMMYGRTLVELRSRIGMLFQSSALFDSLTVAENVGLGLKETERLKEAEIDRIVREKLEMVGLSEVFTRNPSQLSGGMRKRVGLARAIANDPEVLLYDEPTTGLDPITADLINNLIVELNQKLNVTSIAVTHDMKSAFRIANRIVMLYEGKVEIDGTPDEIRNSANPVVRQFIEASSIGPLQVQ